MRVCGFTKPELEFLRENCNFVNLEVDVFEMRAKGIPLEAIAEALNISADTARKYSQRINKKIGKVL
nr:MAG TPA: ECF sigma factor [Caudoviricetes sp.]